MTYYPILRKIIETEDQWASLSSELSTVAAVFFCHKAVLLISRLISPVERTHVFNEK